MSTTAEERWPLYTTEPPDRAEFYEMLREEARQFVWVHVYSQRERDSYLDLIRAAGWHVIQPLPRYYVLACRPGTPVTRRERVRRLVMPTLREEDVRFMGNEFGYPDEEIEWYIDAIRACHPTVE